MLASADVASSCSMSSSLCRLFFWMCRYGLEVGTESCVPGVLLEAYLNNAELRLLQGDAFEAIAYWWEVRAKGSIRHRLVRQKGDSTDKSMQHRLTQHEVIGGARQRRPVTGFASHEKDTDVLTYLPAWSACCLCVPNAQARDLFLMLYVDGAAVPLARVAPIGVGVLSCRYIHI